MKYPLVAIILICACVQLASSAPFVRNDFVMLYPMNPYIQYDDFSFNVGKIFQKAADSVKHAYSYVNNWFFGKLKMAQNEYQNSEQPKDQFGNIKPQVSVKAYKVYKDSNGNLMVKKIPKIGEINNKHSNNDDQSFIQPIFLDDNNLNEEMQQASIDERNSSRKKDLKSEEPDTKVTKNPFRWNEKLEKDNFFSKAFEKYIIHPIILIKRPLDEPAKKPEQTVTELNEKPNEISDNAESTTIAESASSTNADTQISQSSNNPANNDQGETEKVNNEDQSDEKQISENSDQTKTTESENDVESNQSQKSAKTTESENIKSDQPRESDDDHHLKQESREKSSQSSMTRESNSEQKQSSEKRDSSESESSTPQSSENESTTLKESTEESSTSSHSSSESSGGSKPRSGNDEKSDNEDKQSSNDWSNYWMNSGLSVRAAYSDQSSQNKNEEHGNSDSDQRDEQKFTTDENESEKKTDDDESNKVNEAENSKSQTNTNDDKSQQSISENPFVKKSGIKEDEDDIIQKVLSIVQPS